jgi:Prophage minor tail protein Z (GPZ)
MQIDISGSTALIADLTDKPNQVNRAMIRTTNRALGSARTVMVRALAADTGLKQSVVRDAMPFTQASLARPIARLSSSLTRIPLFDFNAKASKRGGVIAKITGGAGRYPHAFFATMASGHEGVFERKGSARLPIHELQGPSLGRVFIKHRPECVAAFWDSFQKNFDHEMQFAGAGVTSDTGTD